MQEDLALTFKQLLCPLLAVNRVDRNGWSIDKLDEKKKFYTSNTQFIPRLTCSISMLCLCVHAFNFDTRARESHAEVSEGASDSVSAYLLRAQRILHLLITQDVWTFKSFKGTSFLNNSCPPTMHTLTDFTTRRAALADREWGRAGIGSNVTKTNTTPGKQGKTNHIF